jgi:hypothetical protein
MNYFLSLGGERIKVRMIRAFNAKGLLHFTEAATHPKQGYGFSTCSGLPAIIDQW